MILEEQIQLAKEMMNKKAKEVECKKDVQKPKLQSIIKNPEDVQHGIPNEVQGVEDIQRVEEVPQVQVQQFP